LNNARGLLLIFVKDVGITLHGETSVYVTKTPCIAAGYDVGEIDGVFGRKTGAAVIALHTNAMAITTADGIADNAVFKLLGI